MLLGVDVGGTFTDAVLFDGRALHTAKAPTTPDDQSRGVLAAVEAALRRAGCGPEQVEAFAHGMTVGTNALLEERGARTALVATEGFTDLLEVARQNRPDLYRLCAPKPAPLVPDELRFAARERMGPAGRRRAAWRTPSWTGWRPSRGQRGRVGGRLPALLLPGPRPRARDRRAPARRARRPSRLGLARGPAAVSRVRALLDHRHRRLPVAPARPLPGAARRGGRRARPARAAGDEVVRRRGARRRGRPGGSLERALGARRRRGRRRAAGHALGGRERGGARHGRHLVRRLRGRGRPGAAHRLAPDRRPGDPAADGRRPHRRGRRRLDRLARPRRRASRRAASRPGPTPGPPATAEAAPSPRSPTPTSCWATWTPPPRSPGAWSWTSRRPATPSGGWGPRSGSTSWRPRRGSSGSPTRRWSERFAWSPWSAALTRAASP